MIRFFSKSKKILYLTLFSFVFCAFFGIMQPVSASAAEVTQYELSYRDNFQWYSVSANTVGATSYWDFVCREVEFVTRSRRQYPSRNDWLSHSDMQFILESIDYDYFVNSNHGWLGSWDTDILCNVSVDYVYDDDRFNVYLFFTDFVPTFVVSISSGHCEIEKTSNPSVSSGYAGTFLSSNGALFPVGNTYWNVDTVFYDPYEMCYDFEYLASHQFHLACYKVVFDAANGVVLSSQSFNMLSLNTPMQYGFYSDMACISFPFLETSQLEDAVSDGFRLFTHSYSGGSHNVYTHNSYLAMPIVPNYEITRGYQSSVISVPDPVPTPSPFPTLVPTISPTPVVLPYDSNVDGFDGTWGFLNSIKSFFDDLSQSFPAISFVTETINYLYAYVPWFKVLFFIPLIAFVSFLIGRNKS